MYFHESYHAAWQVGQADDGGIRTANDDGDNNLTLARCRNTGDMNGEFFIGI